MRYLDELLALYPGKDPFTRKFILAQLLDQPPDSHSDQVVELLWGESRDADAVVRRQARYSLGQYLPALAAFNYGFRAPATAGRAPATAGRALAAGAAVALKPVMDGVLARLDSGSPVERVAASLVLGRIHTPEVLALLTSAVGRADLSYMAGFSLAESGGEAAVEALVAAAEAHGRARPDLYMLLRGLPCAATFECLASQEESADAAGRANIAQALAQFASAQSRPVLERLVRRREGWVSAYVLDTLAGHGDPDDLPLIRLAYELEPHEFIRLQAVRAAGGIRTDAARAFCLEVLASAGPRVQSAALEALIGQDMAPAELARMAEPFLTADFARTRVQAMLAVSRHDPDRAAGSLTPMILAPEALLRLEGAYLTGLTRPPGGLSLLERMATSDPSMGVRMQAVKSLALWTAGEALPVLARLLSSPQRPLLLTVCRTLTGLERPGAVVNTIADALPGLPSASARAAALKAMGMAARLSERPPPGALVDALDDPDALVKIGALEGLKYSGDAIPIERVRPLLAHADPRVRARAAMVSFLAGHPDDAAALAPLLTSGDEAQVLEALSALLELASVVPHADRGGFARLRDALSALAPEPAAPLPVASAPLPAAPVPARPTAKTRPVPSLRKAELLLAMSGPQPMVGAASRDVGALASTYGEKNKAQAIVDDSSSSFKLPSIAVPQPASPSDLSGRSGVIQRPQKATGRERPIAPPPATAGKRAGLAALGVLAALGLAVFQRMGSEGENDPTRPQASAAIAQRTALRVWSVTGACARLGADGKPLPLVVGSYLKAGDRLTTEPGGRLQMRFQDGSAVHLGPASRITAGAAVERSDHGPLPAVQLEDPAGEVQVEAKVTELHVRIGPAVYRTRSGRARIMASGTECRVEQQEGDGTLLKGADRQVLVAGQTASVAP